MRTLGAKFCRDAQVAGSVTSVCFLFFPWSRNKFHMNHISIVCPSLCYDKTQLGDEAERRSATNASDSFLNKHMWSLEHVGTTYCTFSTVPVWKHLNQHVKKTKQHIDVFTIDRNMDNWSLKENKPITKMLFPSSNQLTVILTLDLQYMYIFFFLQGTTFGFHGH